MVTLVAADYDAWRHAARQLLTQATPPDAVAWHAESDQAVLPLPAMDVSSGAGAAGATTFRVPRRFDELARAAACHRSERKWDALYRVLWRIVHDGPHALEQTSDPDAKRLEEMASAVRRDEHKMHAFVRFTPVSEGDGIRYVAWYEPDHLIVRRAAPFFAERFASMRWSILTPDEAVHWDGAALSFTAGVGPGGWPRTGAPGRAAGADSVTDPARVTSVLGAEDGAAFAEGSGGPGWGGRGHPPSPSPAAHDAGEIEELWRVYYAAIFNPARANPRAMLKEMPLRRWQGLPEATLIPRLLNTAHERTLQLEALHVSNSARPFVPEGADLAALRAAAPCCQGCDLHRHATQAVFGEGPMDAEIVLVGEQPGDQEDLAGRPFVGPAGQVLDRALAAAGIDRQALYVTNAVKHFAFEPRGKRRIHRRPQTQHIVACRPWLEAELQAIRPRTVVALGNTAAQALLGPSARVMAMRGRVMEGLAWAPRVFVTLHPSAVLRSEDDGARYFEMLVADLTLASNLQRAGPRRTG